jgi:6,7-dimethyl-8-ribityllumazine synthase
MATVNKIYPFMIKTVFQSEKFSFWSVVAEWNEAITEGLYNGAEQAFLKTRFPLNIYDGMFLEVSN